MGLLQFLSYHNKDDNEFPLTCSLLLNKNSWNHGLTWAQLSQNVYSSGFCLDRNLFLHTTRYIQTGCFYYIILCEKVNFEKGFSTGFVLPYFRDKSYEYVHF